jgi:hypothetical protein
VLKSVDKKRRFKVLCAKRRRYKMEAVVFEIIMGIFFDAGMLAMVVHAAQHIGEDTGRVRFTAAVFAIGFFLGMIAKCVVGGSYIALALYALGFVLSYTAVVFTVPEKEHTYEGR